MIELIAVSVLIVVVGVVQCRLYADMRETDAQIRDLRDRIKEIERVVLDRH